MDRQQALNDAPVRAGARYVLYWAQMNRRVDANHALARAIEIANELAVPVLYYEALTCDYPYANDRLHTFVLQGVAEQERRCAARGIGYGFYLRKRRSDANDVLYKLAVDAACVVTDDYPTFIARRHNARVPAKLNVRYEVVDSSCVVPMRAYDKREYAAYTIRPKIHRQLAEYMTPCAMPDVRVRWTSAAPEWHTRVDDIAQLVSECEIDHTVAPAVGVVGGRAEAERRLRHFLENNLCRYARERNEPAAKATSQLSAYLHFGQLSALEVALAARDYAREHQLIADEFLEELIVRRELAFNYARWVEQPDTLTNLPDWARATLAKHDGDRRDYVYTREQFEQAATHDALWNACQRELLLRGTIHGYYRMYWGKKVIEWSATHADALTTMVYLHDRYALDGRDPNTYTNILWCFGLHDRPWAERAVFGMIRYMGLEGMRRKTGVDAYLREIAELGQDEFELR